LVAALKTKQASGNITRRDLKAVSFVAQEMSRICGYSERLQKLAYVAGLLHDTGKATKSFQDYLSTGQTDDESISPMHHEISWAFLIQTYGISDDNYWIFSAIYWHHARPLDGDYEYLKSRDEIIEKIKNADFKLISMLIQSLELPNLSGVVMDRDERVPDLFSSDSTGDKNTNAEMLAVRMCLISADRLVSKMSADDVAAIAQGTISPSALLSKTQRPFFETIPCPAEYHPSRFNLQLSCAKESLKARTTIVKAPAGYGKTLIGVLNTLLQGKQSYWVCPRNVVAEAVYENIVREISALNINCSTELFLSGERKKANTPGGLIPDFSSDIVVTNIDNLLGPMVNNRTAERLFDILSGLVVIDEFHEFASDSPLFAAFITYMRARHRLSSTACTLLLSATPLNMHKLWDSDHLTALLPDKENHYPAAHEGTYHTTFISEFPEQVQSASLCVFNSVSMAQKQFVDCQMEYLVHSRFIDADRQQIMDRIYSAFGKDGTGVVKGERVSSAPVIQAAMDISLVNLYDSVCSPETTLQRIGRCNRWGTYDDRIPTIFLYVPDLKSLANERGAIDTIYNRQLRDLWVQYLQKKITGSQALTLKAWYEIYNSFYVDHGRDVWRFLKEQYKNGLDYLIEYYPVKLLEDSAEKSHGGKSLRSPSGSYYFTVKINGTKSEWLKPADVMEEGNELYRRFMNKGELNAELVNSSKMLPRIKALYECGYIRFRRIIKKRVPPRNLPHWFRLARDPETPIPDFSRVYDKKLGLKQNT
jgi:CRISPR-associated endonuclease/helicase Cas3